MLPLPRPRPDPDVVRGRLRALAEGRWDAALDPGPQRAPDLDAVRDEPPVVVPRSPVRAVALAVGATALATWAVVHLTAGGAPSPVELLPGTPLASASGVLVPAPTGTASAPVGAEPTPTASPLVVQVVGDVRRPGLVRLPPGSRVGDAVRAAGGLAPGGRTGGLNLARLVVDGEQIVVSGDVPVPPPASGGSAAPADGGVVDLNSATASDLDALPGVGPVMAGRILDWRSAHGRFTSVDQLREVSGIGVRTYERLKPHVRV